MVLWVQRREKLLVIKIWSKHHNFLRILFFLDQNIIFLEMTQQLPRMLTKIYFYSTKMFWAPSKCQVKLAFRYTLKNPFSHFFLKSSHYLLRFKHENKSLQYILMSAVLEINNEYLRCKGGLINHCLIWYRKCSRRYESSMSRCLPNTKYGDKITRRNNAKIRMGWPCK